MEKLIKYIGEHNSGVVFGLVGSIVFLFSLILYFYLKSKNKTNPAVLSSIDSIEGALRRVLEDREWQNEEMGTQKDKVAVATLELKIKTLQEELEKKGSAVTTNPESEAEKQKLLDKLRELEGKLAEYAIIEDDIADLNTFKKENKELKDKLESLKLGAVHEAVVTQTPPAKEDLSEEQENIFGEFEKVVKNQNANHAMSEFSKKVQEEAPAMSDSPKPQVKVIPPAATAPVGKVQMVEKDDGVSAYSDEVAKDTAKEAELFVKDFQDLFNKE